MLVKFMKTMMILLKFNKIFRFAKFLIQFNLFYLNLMWRASLVTKIEVMMKSNFRITWGMLLFSTILNNIGVQQMGYYMPIYSEFLLYGTTFFYTIMFAITAWIVQENWKLSWDVWKTTIWLGLFTSLNGIFAQISIPFVDPEITTIIVQISAPVVWGVHVFMFRDKQFTLFHLFSIIIILIGVFFGPIISLFYGSGAISNYVNGFWIFITLCSAIPTGFETLFQEKAYRLQAAPKFVTLTFYNLFSFIWYFLWSFMTTIDPFGTCVDGFPALNECAAKTRPCKMNELVAHQIDSWKCFFGDTENVPCCGDRATLWVMVFTIGYYFTFTVGAFFLRVHTANSVANTNAFSTPLTSMFFWLPVIITGHSHSEFKWWILVSFIMIGIGIVGYESYGGLNHRFNKILLNKSDRLEEGLIEINNNTSKY